MINVEIMFLCDVMIPFSIPWNVYARRKSAKVQFTFAY